MYGYFIFFVILQFGFFKNIRICMILLASGPSTSSNVSGMFLCSFVYWTHSVIRWLTVTSVPQQVHRGFANFFMRYPCVAVTIAFIIYSEYLIKDNWFQLYL